MIATDRAEIICDGLGRAMLYERLAFAVELCELNLSSARTQWESELWRHIALLCAEALGEVGETVEQSEAGQSNAALRRAASSGTFLPDGRYEPG